MKNRIVGNLIKAKTDRVKRDSKNSMADSMQSAISSIVNEVQSPLIQQQHQQATQTNTVARHHVMCQCDGEQQQLPNQQSQNELLQSLQKQNLRLIQHNLFLIEQWYAIQREIELSVTKCFNFLRQSPTSSTNIQYTNAELNHILQIIRNHSVKRSLPYESLNKRTIELEADLNSLNKQLSLIIQAILDNEQYFPQTTKYYKSENSLNALLFQQDLNNYKLQRKNSLISRSTNTQEQIEFMSPKGKNNSITTQQPETNKANFSSSSLQNQRNSDWTSYRQPSVAKLMAESQVREVDVNDPKKSLYKSQARSRIICLDESRTRRKIPKDDSEINDMHWILLTQACGIEKLLKSDYYMQMLQN